MIAGIAEHLNSRVEQALLILDLPSLIWRRLCRESTPLPPLTRDEDPADVFVDAVALAMREEVLDVAESLRNASAQALRRFGLRADSVHLLQPLGELIYLCGRIEAIQAIEPLNGLLRSHSWGAKEVAPGEPLHRRSLRSLVGLLAVERRTESRESRDQAEVLERFLSVPGCELLALTGLVGLNPGQRQYYLQNYHQKGSPFLRDQLDEQLQVSLDVAGFRQPAPPHSAGLATIAS